MPKKSFTIRLAEQSISVTPLFDDISLLCRDYLTSGTAAFTVQTTPQSIDYEREKVRHSRETYKLSDESFSDAYLETLVVYRRIAEQMPSYNTVLIHSSVIAVDGQAYLFTAKSGTGKSTHTKLWREVFGERAVMVNDDKPLVRITDNGVIAYGTPWDGKHHISHNIAVPLRAVVALRRDTENHIERVSAKDLYPLMVQQTYRPADPAQMMKTVTLLDKLMKQVPLYTLGCNMRPEAAQVAYDGMNPHEGGAII